MRLDFRGVRASSFDTETTSTSESVDMRRETPVLGSRMYQGSARDKMSHNARNSSSRCYERSHSVDSLFSVQLVTNSAAKVCSADSVQEARVLNTSRFQFSCVIREKGINRSRPPFGTNTCIMVRSRRIISHSRVISQISASAATKVK